MGGTAGSPHVPLSEAHETPRLSTLLKVAKALNVLLAELLKGGT